MNLKTAKRIRKALAYHPHRHTTTYEKLDLHHISQHPQYETHQRTIRTLARDSKGRYYNAEQQVTKIRYAADGKTPLRPVLNEKGEPVFQIAPVAKPVRLKKDSPRRVYRLLKRLERTVGLDQVFAQLVQETAGVPA